MGSEVFTFFCFNGQESRTQYFHWRLKQTGLIFCFLLDNYLDKAASLEFRMKNNDPSLILKKDFKIN